MSNSKLYAILAIALGAVTAAPAQAGWDAWNAPPTTGTARQQVAPDPNYQAYAQARHRRSPNAKADIPTLNRSRPIVGHTGHMGGY